MGHEPVLFSSAEFFSSKLPEHWMPLYQAVVALTCKNTGTCKINKTQLMVLYSLYHDTHIDIGRCILECFLNIMAARKDNVIVCHRFWSVLVSEAIKDQKHVVEEGTEIMPICSMDNYAARRASILFSHPGHIPQTMLLRIPTDNAVLIAYNKQLIVYSHRTYDTSKFAPEKSKGKRKVREEPSKKKKSMDEPQGKSKKRKHQESEPSKPPPKKKSKKPKSIPIPEPEPEPQQESTEQDSSSDESTNVSTHTLYEEE
ncbi:hypothetical protein E9993_23070, partial [Labilibacter sediminis]